MADASPRSPAPAVALADWLAVASKAELQLQAERAAADARPLIIHVRAQWAAPCVAVEQDVYAHSDVAGHLKSYRRVFVDLTEGEQEALEVQAALGANTLPAIYVFPQPAALAAYLGGRGARPIPSVTVNEAVDSATFLHRLRTPHQP